jgi:type II secretory pathway component PulJ
MLMRRAQGGLTLIELLIGSTLGLLILGALLGLYANTVASSGAGLRMAHLQQQLRAALEVMGRDLRRAGYYGVAPDAATLALLRRNPFTDADDPDKAETQRNDLRIGHYQGGQPENAGSCILYSYDLDADGSVTPSGTGMERFGFRLRAGRLQMRFGGEPFDCTQGSWTTVTDDGVEITRLHFQLLGTPLHPLGGENTCVAGEPCLYVRAVQIELSGRLRADPEVRMELRERVRLRNDRYLAVL